MADNPLPLTSENIAGRAKGQSARRWTHQVTPRRARVWRVHRGSTLYNYLKENMAPLTDRPGEAADLIIGNRSERFVIPRIDSVAGRAMGRANNNCVLQSDTSTKSTPVVTEYHHSSSGGPTEGRKNCLVSSSPSRQSDQRHQMMTTP